MKALILIGGLGTRLRPLTCHAPKPLLPIVNRPFLEYQFMLLKKYGIKDEMVCACVYVCVCVDHMHRCCRLSQ